MTVRLRWFYRILPTRKYRPNTGNKPAKKRLDWEHTEGGVGVIKGTSNRVVVVSSPLPRVFEQAIFIVREDFAGQAGVSKTDILRQAREAADEYLRTEKTGKTGKQHVFRRMRIPAPASAALGAAAGGVTWLLFQVIF